MSEGNSERNEITLDSLKPDVIDRILDREPEKARQLLEMYATGAVPEMSLEAWICGLLFCVKYFLKKFRKLRRKVLKPTPTIVLMDLGIVSKTDELNLFTKRQVICLDDVEHDAFLRMISQLHTLARKFPSCAQKLIAIINSLNQAIVGQCIKTYSIDVLVNYMSTIYVVIRSIIEESRLERYTRKATYTEGEEP